MPVELTPIPDDIGLGNEQHVILIDSQGKKRKIDLQLTIESEEFQCRFYAFTGFHFIGGLNVFSVGKTHSDQSNKLLPLEGEELELVSETIQAAFTQVRKEMREKHPILSKWMPWLFNAELSPNRTVPSVPVESVDAPYTYYLK